MSKGRENHIIWGDCEKMNSGGDTSSGDFQGSVEKARMKGLTLLDESSLSSTEGASNSNHRAVDPGGHIAARLEELGTITEIGDVAEATELMKKAGMWSVGSAKHGAGQCRPCHFVHTKDGCKDKEACQFCHLPHTSMNQKRPSKPRRQQCQMLASVVHEASAILNAGEYSDVVENISSRSNYMQRVLKNTQKPVTGGDMDQRNLVSL